MQIQVNTDSHIDASANFNEEVQAFLTDKLKRFSSRITRIEVSFTDQNSSAKAGGDDKRCVLEARLNSMQPVAVSATAAEVKPALSSAVNKLQSMLDSTLGKLDSR